MKGTKSHQSTSEGSREKLQFEALEPRVLFSATMADPNQEQPEDPTLVQDLAFLPAALDSEQGVAEAPGLEILRQLNHRAADGETESRRELVFIAGDLEGREVLFENLDPSYEVHWIGAGSDGIKQIADVLQGRSGIEAIHLISHGESGRLFLGNSVLDSVSMTGTHAELLREIGGALSDDADLLIYGCDFGSGEAGAAATALLAEATGADVAASDDKTGHADLGGDWVLETSSGSIEASSVAVASWRGVLAPAVLTVGANSLSVFDDNGNSVNVGNSVSTAGSYAVWSNAGTVGSQQIDLIARIVTIGAGDTVTFQNPASGTDDAAFTLNSGGNSQTGDVLIEWSIVLAGTTTAATGDITFTIGDIDGINGNPNTRETVVPTLNGLTAYGANSPTNIEFTVNNGSVSASGTDDENIGSGTPTEPEAAALFTWRNVSSWEVAYQLAANNVTTAARFTHDGDGDFVFPSLQVVNLLAIDLDANNSTASGNNYATRFDEGGSAVLIADSDSLITQNVALGGDIGSATVILTNAQAGDELLVNGSTNASGTINGVNYTITSNAGQIEIEFTGDATLSVYENLIESISFRNNQTGLSAVDRNIEVTVFNTTYSTTSNTAISTIDVNRRPVANTATTNTAFGVAVAVPLTGNDTDPDGDAISIVGTPVVANAAHGTLAFQNNQWVFTPANGFSGTAVINYTIQDVHGVTSSSTHNVVVENAPPVLGDPDPTQGTPYVNPLNTTNLIVPATDNVPLSLDLDLYITDANSDTLTFTPDLNTFPTWLSYDPATKVISGTPPVDNTGPVTVSLTVTDPNGGSFVGTITIAPTNPAPVANPQSVTTPYLTPIVVNLTGNDTDPDGDAISVQGTPTLVNPAHGTLSSNNGVWTFTPATGFSGTAVINYTIVDADGATASSTHTVVVENAPPVLGDPDPTQGTPYINPLNATNLIVPATDNVPLSLDLDLYITDANGDTLTFTPDLNTFPSWLSFDPATKVLSGTPPVDNTGPVTISLTVTDPNGGSFVGTVTISPTNPGPVANPQTVTTPYLTPVVVNVTGNDSDPDGDVFAVWGMPTLVNPAHGSISFANGNWIFTPATGFSGSAVINYSIADADGAIASSTHTVIVENAPPVLGDPDPTQGTPYVNPLNTTNLIVPATDNVPLSLDLDLYITDPNSDTLTFTPDLNTFPTWLSYDPATKVISGTPPVDNTGPVTVSLTVTDPNGGSFVGTITIAPTNPAPVANPQTVTTPYGTPIQVLLAGNDTDPDGDAISIQGTPTLVNPAHGSLSSNNGVWTFTPALGFSGTAVINYTIVDADGATSSSTHTVIVENAPPVLNDPTPNPGSPYINPLNPTNLIVPAVDNQALSLDLELYIADPNGDTLIYTPDLNALPTWLSYDGVNHVLSGTPPVGNVAAVTIPVTVTDSNGGSFVGSITVSPTNPAPVANPQTVTTPYLTPIAVNFLGNDTDPDGDAIMLQLMPAVVNPAHGSLSFANGQWTFTPAVGFSGTAVINYTIVDADGATSSSTHTVIVENAPPVLGDPDPTQGTPYVNPLNTTNLIVPATDNVPLSLDLDLYITDANGDTLTFTPDLNTFPTWLSYDPATKVISGTPPVDNTGPVTVSLTVTDPNGGSFVGTITIAPTNPAPVANPQSVTTPYLTPIVVNLTGNDTDPDGDAISVQGTPTLVNPAHGTLSSNNGVWTFTPATGFSGTAVINYTIVDADGATASSTHTVVVENAPPVLGDPDPTQGTPYINPLNATNLIVPAVDNVAVSVNLNLYLSDPNSDPLQISANLTGLPGWVTFDANTGVLSGTPPVDNAGPVVVPITVTDGQGGSFAGTVTINPVNPIPVAEDDDYDVLQTSPAIVVGNALDNDSDPDGDPLTAVEETDVPGSNGGLFSIDENGDVTFDPNGEFDDLLGGETRTTTYTYTMCDSDGDSVTATITVTVTGVNSPPDPNSGSITVNVGSRGGSLGLTAPTDPDGDPLTITVKKLPRVGTLRLPNGTPIQVGQVLTARQLERLVYDAPASHRGDKPVRFYYTVSDGQEVKLAKVDIAIVSGKCYSTYFPSMMKAWAKKNKH